VGLRREAMCPGPASKPRGERRHLAGLVSGFGLRRHGCARFSVRHDSHNLIVVGTNPRDMLACIRSLEESGGGFVVAADGAVRASLPLAIAGLISTASADDVCRQFDVVNAAARELGCPPALRSAPCRSWRCRSSPNCASRMRPIRCGPADLVPL